MRHQTSLYKHLVAPSCGCNFLIKCFFRFFCTRNVAVSLGDCYDFTYFISGLCHNLIAIIDGEFAFVFSFRTETSIAVILERLLIGDSSGLSLATFQNSLGETVLVIEHYLFHCLVSFVVSKHYSEWFAFQRWSLIENKLY